MLIRVDGEAVLVNFVEDHPANADVGGWSPLESAKLDMRHSQSATTDSGESQSLMKSLVSDGESRVGEKFEALPTRTVSHQDRITEAREDTGLGFPTSEFAEESQPFVNQILDEQLEIYPVLVKAAGEPLQPIKKGTPIPGLDTLIITPSDCNIDERTDEFDQLVFLEAGVDDVLRDGMDSLEEREGSDTDVAFSPWNLIDDHSPDESETSSETVSVTNSSVGLQDTPIPVKNVRFAVGDDASAVDCWQVSLNVSHTDEYTCASNFGGQLGDEGDVSVHIPVVPFDPSTDEQDATSPEQVTEPILPVVLSEERREENDVVFAECCSPSLTGKPKVNLPSVVAIREDLQFVEMIPMVPVAFIEDIATRSPLQIFSPITPAVVISMKYIIEAEKEETLTSPGTEELVQGLRHAEHAFDWAGTLNDNSAACETSDIVSREDISNPPTRSIEGSNSVSPITDRKPPLGDARALDIALSSEIGVPMASTSPVATNTDTSAAIEVPGTNELGAETLYETSRHYSDEGGLAKSLRNELQGPDVSVPNGATSRIDLAAVSESSGESSVEDQVTFVTAGKSDSTITTLTSQPVDLSGASATDSELLMKSSKQLLALSDTCKDATSLSMISAHRKADELNHGKGREAGAMPWDHASTTSKPPPERTLSGSMHAPSESWRIPQTDSHINLTSVLYETSPFVAHFVSLAKPDEGKRGTSMIAESTSKPKQDLSASIHAPQKRYMPEVQSSVSQSRDESNRDHHRSVTNPVVVPERKSATKPCPPNWTAMPEVVDAFRMFKQAPREKTIRRVSSLAECTNRGPVVGQKGTATSSLNNTSATANIQSRWMHESGLLLVRDLVSSDPVDFNLRTWQVYFCFVGWS